MGTYKKEYGIDGVSARYDLSWMDCTRWDSFFSLYVVRSLFTDAQISGILIRSFQSMASTKLSRSHVPFSGLWQQHQRNRKKKV